MKKEADDILNKACLSKMRNIYSYKRILNDSNVTPTVLEALRNGSEIAFVCIYNYYRDSVIRFLNTILLSMDLAEDFSQELFTNIWARHKYIQPDRNFKSYIFTIARNMAIDFYRQKKEFNLHENSRMDIVDSQYPDDKLIAYDTWHQILRIMNKMPKRRCRVFILSRCYNLTNEEISQHLHITKNAVEKHISFALRDIRITLFLPPLRS